MDYKELKSQIRTITRDRFDKLALDIFHYQVENNPLYAEYCSLIGVIPKGIHEISSIPFMPISFFKQHRVKSGDWQEETIFYSSGTTGEKRSKHYIKDVRFYLDNAVSIFRRFYGPPDQYCFLVLLPGYDDRPGSSLISMVSSFVEKSIYPQSGFYADDTDLMFQALKDCIRKRVPTILFGVSFALYDFAGKYSLKDPGWTIINTGGMKSREHELNMDAWSSTIKRSFPRASVNGEYGMTELLSQAYSTVLPVYVPGTTLRVLASEVTDPFSIVAPGKTGRLNFIDIANIDTCSFIASDDLGKIDVNGSFELFGRLDNSDLRGCNLLYAEER